MMNFRWDCVLNCLLIIATEFVILKADRIKRTTDKNGLPNPRIVEHPQNQYVAKNDPATLNCKAEGDPPPTITWYRNKRPVITARENPTSHRTLVNYGQLFFYRIIHNKNNKPDVGTYYCNATNIHGTAISKNATLEIAVLRDDFKLQPKNKQVAVGDAALLECRPPKGQPDPRVKWLKDKEPVVESSRFRLQENGNLVITDTRKSDSGVYVCVAYNIADERLSPKATLSVLEKPKFIKQPDDILVTENEDVQFECKASGDPAPVIVWRKDDGQIPVNRNRILEDKSLKISRVKVDDEGLYVCKAENPVGTIEAVGRLTVHSHPSFVTTPQDKVVGVGRTVTLKCEVTGNPPPAVFWNKEDSQILMFPRQDHGRFSVTEEGTLIIERSQKDDAGEYICQALSVAGSAFAKAKVEVKDVDPRPPPIIHQGPQNQTLPINSVAMLICQSSGDPQPTAIWYKDGKPMEGGSSTRVTLLGSGTLQISDLQFSDTGLYTCKAVSETGETSWSAALTVEAPSKASVIFHRTPEPSTFPGPPSKPIITEVTENSVKLMWKQNPNQGASPVIAYTVEYFSHETGEGWVVASDHVQGNLEYYEVKNLRRDTSYMFLIRAKNSHGLSLPSSVSEPVRTGGDGSRPTLAQFDIPLVEQKLSGSVVQLREPEVISSTAVKINWNVVKSHKYIEGFHIKYRPMPLTHAHHHHHHHVEYSIETVTSQRATMYVLRNLQKYTWYEIRIQPFYLTVEGQLSNGVRVQTLEDVPSMPPQNIVARKVANNSILIAWSPPAKDHRNGILKGYKIYCIGNSSKFSRNITTNATTNKYPIRNVIPDMMYKIYIAATTRMGVGVRSEAQIVGGTETSSYVQNFVNEPWFIPTIIGIFGGMIWFALCVFSIWLYKKRRNRKPYIKAKNPGMVLNLSGKQPEEVALAGRDGYPSMRDPYGHKENEHVDMRGQQPDVTNILEKRQQKMQDYNHDTSDVTQMKTFYNKANPISLPVAPYATTNLCTSNNLINQQSGNSAFTPVKNSYIPRGVEKSGSNDSCQKDLMNDSNSDNSRPNTGHYGVPSETMPMISSDQSPTSDGNYTIDENGMPVRRTNMHMAMRNPVLNFADLLPPPPENPPPSDIGTPPDSPTRGMSPTKFEHNYRVPMPQSQQRQAMNAYRSPHDRLPTPPRNLPLSDNERRSMSPRNQPYNIDERRTQSPRNDLSNRVQSPKQRCQSPRGYNDKYQIRGASDPEGPMPPRGGFKVLPTDHDHRFMSDSEVRTPRLYPQLPPSPTNGVSMDRAIQSSLPSLVSEPIHSPVHSARLESTPNGPSLSVDLYHQGGGDSPVYDGEYLPPEHTGESDPSDNPEQEYPEREYRNTERDCASPESSVGELYADGGSMMASWASVTDGSNSECTSARSSLASSSDGSFLTEADFATAVAKAAELSGLTVVGSTVCDPSHQQGKQGKRYHKHRERAKRPTSPYSTDSNYSAVPPQPRKPYPKSQRKQQLQDQGQHAHRHRRDPDLGQGHQGQGHQGQRVPPAPPERANSLRQHNNVNNMNKTSQSPHQNGEWGPPQYGELPSYNKPNFPVASSGNTGPRNMNTSTGRRHHRNDPQDSSHTATLPNNAHVFEQPPVV
ncbi:roundabout homolog 2-like isoform X2 [Lineus longissimus]|uniref:roundabout homolog 2-like isoform X2 n=1 Tax=Lineus longissimus TaxID=88925 RepID=UPI00315D5175